jgi:hypothetical protein
VVFQNGHEFTSPGYVHFDFRSANRTGCGTCADFASQNLHPHFFYFVHFGPFWHHKRANMTFFQISKTGHVWSSLVTFGHVTPAIQLPETSIQEPT